MSRLPWVTASRIHASAFSGVPMASSMSSARLGAPPWSGPDRAPMAPVTADPRSAPVEERTRASQDGHGRQQRLDLRGNVAQRPDLVLEILELGFARKMPAVEQVPHVLERPL